VGEYDCEGNPLGSLVDGPTCSSPLAEGEIDCEGKPLGTVFGACLGIDDVVDVSFNVNVNVGSTQYDVGLYINLNGGDAAYGDTSPGQSPGDNDACTVAQLTQTGYERKSAALVLFYLMYSCVQYKVSTSWTLSFDLHISLFDCLCKPYILT